MKTELKSYLFLDHTGVCHLPTRDELIRLTDEGLGVDLMLDANICLDICSFIKHRQNSRVDKVPLFNLLEYLTKNDVILNPMFGLLELCSNPSEWSLDAERFADMKNKVDFATQFPLKLLRRYEFDFNENYKIFRKPELRTDIGVFSPMLLASYACLLKINAICKKGIGRNHAVKNIYTLLDWMVKDLGVIHGTEIQLGLNIFGGENKVGLAKMIGMGGKPETVIKSSWGTAWDLFHIRFCCNSFSFSKNMGENLYLIFVTNDNRLNTLISQISLASIVEGEGTTGLYESFIDLPYYDDTFRSSFALKMTDLFKERMHYKKEVDHDKLIKLCSRLEQELYA